MMKAIEEHLPVLMVIIPLFIAFILPTLAKKMKLVTFLVILACVLGLAGAGYAPYLYSHRSGGTPVIYSPGDWPAPWGIELVAGNLSTFFLLVVFGVGLPVALFSVNNLELEIGNNYRVSRFYALFLMLLGALAGMAVTNDIFNVFVLVEVATLSCCGLVCSRNHPRAAEAAFSYLILATLGSTLVLGGIGFIYLITGHLNMGFASMELNRVWQTNPYVVWLGFSFLLVGFGVKSALFPLHIWLPDAHATAPSPASAVLSGLAVKGYMICLMKILYGVFGLTLLREFGVDKILLTIGSLAITGGAVMAIRQGELKRRLAYSTVSQVGYIFLGLGLINTKGLAGTLFYLASHALIKATLFMSAGALIAGTGKKNIRDMAGVGKKMPVTTAAFTISSLGLIGIPMFSGFVGKWQMVLGSLEAGYIIPSLVVIAGSVLCAAYLLPVVRIAYFEPAPNDDWKDPGIYQRIALLVPSLMVILLGLVPGPLLTIAEKAAGELLLR